MTAAGGEAATIRPMPPSASRPILVVDDDAKIVRLVRTYLEREGLAVIEAGDGNAALAAIALHDPALVVLDLMLPEVDGLAIIAAVRRNATTPIIVLSARGTTADRIEGLEVGADDYLAKPFSPAELMLRIHALLRRSGGGTGGGTGGASVPAAPALRLGDLVVDPDRHAVQVAGRDVTLTAVELRLLVVLLEADGRVLSRDQLLSAVYGADDEGVLDRTIDVHVGRLRDKLGDAADEPRFIATVRGVGYRAAGRVERGS